MPVYVSGEGREVTIGSSLSAVLPEGHPLRYNYETWNLGPNRGRSSWDLIAVLYALDPEVSVLKAEPRQQAGFDPEECRSYWGMGCRQDYEIMQTVSNEELAAFLEARMVGRNAI